MCVAFYMWEKSVVCVWLTHRHVGAVRVSDGARDTPCLRRAKYTMMGVVRERARREVARHMHVSHEDTCKCEKTIFFSCVFLFFSVSHSHSASVTL
jgi:hypothetical protein